VGFTIRVVWLSPTPYPLPLPISCSYVNVVIFHYIPTAESGHNAQGTYVVVLVALTVNIDYSVSMMSSQNNDRSSVVGLINSVYSRNWKSFP
jgi:hypothetical protein